MEKNALINEFSYKQDNPNDPIEVYKGKAIFELGENKFDGICTINISWHPNMIIRFLFESSFFHMEFDQTAYLYLEEWDQRMLVYLDNIKYSVNTNSAITQILGKLAPAGFLLPPINKTLRKLSFHIINLNNMDFYEVVSEDRFGKVNVLQLFCEDWKFSIQRYTLNDEIYKKLEHFNGFAITHTVDVERLTPYHKQAYDSILEISEFLTYFLSFHRGLWISVCLPVGINTENEVILRGLHGSRIDFWQTIPDLSFAKYSQNLTRSIDEFWKKWCSDKWHDALKMIIHWYIESNTLSGGFQGAIVQQQAAFERFAWTLKENNLAFKNMADGKFNSMPAAEKISEILKWAHISDNVPPHIVSLINYFEEKQKVMSGSELLVEIRNGLVHPKPSRREMLNDVSDRMLHDIHAIGQSYLRQIIGKVVGLPPVGISFAPYELKNKS